MGGQHVNCRWVYKGGQSRPGITLGVQEVGSTGEGRQAWQRRYRIQTLQAGRQVTLRGGGKMVGVAGTPVQVVQGKG